jgi:hypothetical protein
LSAHQKHFDDVFNGLPAGVFQELEEINSSSEFSRRGQLSRYLIEKSGMFSLTSTFLILNLNESGISIKVLNKPEDQDHYLKVEWSHIHSVEALFDS